MLMFLGFIVLIACLVMAFAAAVSVWLLFLVSALFSLFLLWA